MIFKKMSKKNFFRIFASLGGAAGTSAANFFISFLLFASVDAKTFGVFSFSQVLTALGLGISNALFGTPLNYEINQKQAESTQILFGYSKACFFITLVTSVLLFFSINGIGCDPYTGFLLSISAFFIWIRWYLRTIAYIRMAEKISVLSDLLMTSASFVGSFFLSFRQNVNLENFSLVLIISGVISLLPFYHEIFPLFVKGVIKGRVAFFVNGFRTKGRHTLVGVVTTEMTANVHAYVVTFLLGPAAFAPLAATLLVFRPIPMTILSLTQSERPRLARFLVENANDDLLHTLETFRKLVFSVLVLNILIAICTVLFFNSFFADKGYSNSQIVFPLILWGVIMSFRCIRGPESAFLQAAGLFKDLSHVTLWTSLLSIPVVIALTIMFGATESLLGVLVAECAAAFFTRLISKKVLLNRVQR